LIVVDTSALLAIILREKEGARCERALTDAEVVLISTATLAETLILSDRRGVRSHLDRLVARIGWQVVPVTEGDAVLVAQAYARCGKGIHPAGLNYGDCFAYALARDRQCPLLYVGGDFARTDVDGCG
jgi:ribonuclease VapC